MKLLTLTVCLVLFDLGISRTVVAQDKTSSSPTLAAESLNREQDGLKGPVRRVRVETAKIVMKGGNLIEAPRMVRGIATYDPAGRKIDSVDYPVEGGTVPGKEQYRYDDQGNIVEMIVRGNDGSILSKEMYEYEFDRLGNWTKMSSSLAVYESGKMGYELTEVTYRQISYYYDQAMETLKASQAKPAGVAATDLPRSSIPAKQVSVTNQPIPLPASADVKADVKKEAIVTATSVPPTQTANLTTESPSQKSSEVNATTGNVATGIAVKQVAEEVRTTAASVPPTQTTNLTTESPLQKSSEVNATTGNVATGSAVKQVEEVRTTAASVPPTQTTNLTAESPLQKSSEVNETTGNVAAGSGVKHVGEEVLRNAAIDLPKPEYSEAARLAQVTGKVEVQILVDDKGQVTNARATSGNSLLSAAAEAAARKARFSPTKLSSDSSRVYGAISYDFRLPGSASTSSPAANPAIDIRQPMADVREPDARPSSETVALVETRPKATPSNSEAPNSAYQKGMAFLASGLYEEAVGALNQAIRADPNDVRGYIKLGMSYSGLHRNKEAIAVYKMAVQINRSALDAPAYYMWGHSYLELNKNSEAVAAFKQALFISRAAAIGLEKGIQNVPTPEQLHYGMGVAYLNSKRFGDSIDELKQVVKLNPKNAAAYYALAIAYIGSNNRMAAENQQKTLDLLDAELARKVTVALAAPPPNAPRCPNIICR